MRPLWWLTKDGDLDCLELYERHYSCYHYADGRERKQFVGPGEKVVLSFRWDAGYLHRLKGGSKTNPSPEILRKLGLRKVVRYVRRKPQP